MPRGKATRRKRSEISVASSCESIEDEDLILQHQDTNKSLKSMLQEPSEAKKDNENDIIEELSHDNDPDNEMSKMLQLLGNDMTKSVAAKRKKMEKFTDAAININLNKMSKVWNEQIKRRNTAVEQFYRQTKENMKEWEEDLIRQNEKSEKVHNILLQHLKVQQQINSSNIKKLSTFRSMNDSFSKNMKNLEEKFAEINESVNQEMKTELMLLQKKILMETQQQDLQEVRKSVQTLLFS